MPPEDILSDALRAAIVPATPMLLSVARCIWEHAEPLIRFNNGVTMETQFHPRPPDRRPCPAPRENSFPVDRSLAVRFSVPAASVRVAKLGPGPRELTLLVPAELTAYPLLFVSEDVEPQHKRPIVYHFLYYDVRPGRITTTALGRVDRIVLGLRDEQVRALTRDIFPERTVRSVAMPAPRWLAEITASPARV
jgi:hypothetical protein